eukprot:6205184-Pleurochrysis_carterae.AAC.4
MTRPTNAWNATLRLSTEQPGRINEAGGGARWGAAGEGSETEGGGKNEGCASASSYWSSARRTRNGEQSLERWLHDSACPQRRIDSAGGEHISPAAAATNACTVVK